jgi:hypothetical protein
MPDPIIEPTTIIVASSKPSTRTSLGESILASPFDKILRSYADSRLECQGFSQLLCRSEPPAVAGGSD